VNKLELLEALRSVEELTLLELLEINSSDLVDAFYDKIEDNIDKIYSKVLELE
jgi:hypothetical protein